MNAGVGVGYVFGGGAPSSTSSSSSLSFKRRNMMLSSFYSARLIHTATTAAKAQSQPQPSSESSAISSSSSPPTPTPRRRLILLRHAHSSTLNKSLIRDHDRPLSKAGQADAIQVSQKLQQLGWIPQLILSSDAARTKETLAIMQQQVRAFMEAEVHFVSSFYSIAAMDGQTAQHLQHAICNLSRDDILAVMCMGHNRGWEEAASMFSGKPVELKTCHAALLEADGDTWEEAFSLAGFGGWKLQGIVKPCSQENCETQE